MTEEELLGLIRRKREAVGKRFPKQRTESLLKTNPREFIIQTIRQTIAETDFTEIVNNQIKESIRIAVLKWLGRVE